MIRYETAYMDNPKNTGADALEDKEGRGGKGREIERITATLTSKVKFVPTQVLPRPVKMKKIDCHRGREIVLRHLKLLMSSIGSLTLRPVESFRHLFLAATEYRIRYFLEDFLLFLAIICNRKNRNFWRGLLRFSLLLGKGPFAFTFDSAHTCLKTNSNVTHFRLKIFKGLQYGVGVGRLVRAIRERY